jgi:hypothetical protein
MGFHPRTVLWAAMVGAVGVYLLLGLQLGGRAPAGSLLPMLPIAFGAIALGNAFAASFFWRRARVAQDEQDLRARESGERPSKPPVFWIVAWAFDEGVAVLGFILALMGYPLSIWIGFLLGAAVLLTLHR